MGHFVTVFDLFVLLTVREDDIAFSNLVLHLRDFFVPERSLAKEHLENEDANGPPVHVFVVARVIQYFRCHIHRRAALSPRHLLLADHLGQAEVNQLNVAVVVQQDVLKLQVSVNDVLVV